MNDFRETQNLKDLDELMGLIQKLFPKNDDDFFFFLRGCVPTNEMFVASSAVSDNIAKGLFTWAISNTDYARELHIAHFLLNKFELDQAAKHN